MFQLVRRIGTTKENTFQVSKITCVILVESLVLQVNIIKIEYVCCEGLHVPASKRIPLLFSFLTRDAAQI